MLFVELPMEILINIFDFVCYLNRFPILKLRLINKYIYNVAEVFLKLKRKERENYKIVLIDKRIRHPKFLKLLIDFIFSIAVNLPFSNCFIRSNYKTIINDCFNEEFLKINAHTPRRTIKFTKLDKPQKISELNIIHYFFV